MEIKAKYVLVGSFILTLLLGAFVAVVWLSNYDYSPGKIYAIYFEGSVSGLRENELVTYNGVPIGFVKKIDIDPQRLNAIRVLAKINQPHLIRKNSKASLEVKGISGNLFIRVHASDPEEPLLERQSQQPYPVIQAEFSAFQKLLNDAPRIAQSLAKLTDKITPFFDSENKESFKEILESLSSFTHTFDKNTKSGLYEFTQLMRDIRELSSSFNRILNKFEDNPRQFLLQTAREDGHVIAP